MHPLRISFVCFLSALDLTAADFLVNQPVVNMHVAPSDEAEVISQCIYAEPIDLLESLGDNWRRIRTPDGDSGWLHSFDLIDNKEYLRSSLLRPVSSLFAHIYRVPDTSPHPPLMTLTFSTPVKLMQEPDEMNRWIQVQLMNGQIGWIQRGDLELNPRPKSLEEVLTLAQQFLDLPYTWGGTSSYGFDCTGYVQTLFKQMGVLLPRHVCPQAPFEELLQQSPMLISVDLSEITRGDLLFFGVPTLHHVGIYLGNNAFIHSGVLDNKPCVNIGNLKTTGYVLSRACRIKDTGYTYTISKITPEIKQKMIYSWKDNNPVGIEELRYLKMRHWGFDGCIHEGEMIVHYALAQEIVDIFGELFDARYPIEKMQLIDAYQANDELSTADNNSSAFCSRPITNTTNRWSKHSYGCAVDINPLVNPYAKNGNVVPEKGRPYLDRTLKAKGLIRKDDACYQAFSKRGWEWGGEWTSCVDYQHFEKNTPQIH